MHSRMRWVSAAVLTLALLGVSAPASAAAVTGVDDFEFASFDAEYTLTRDTDGTSVLHVVETIVARFPDFQQNRGIIRAIPAHFQEMTLKTRVESVVDDAGRSIPYETTWTSDFMRLRIGSGAYVFGLNTYVITYTQRNVVGFYADTNANEFYWDVNGTGWPQPFDRVSATVVVDPSLASSLTGSSACYFGADGSTDQCTLNSQLHDGYPVFTAAVSKLQPHETMTFAIGFVPETFTPGDRHVPGTIDFGWVHPPLWASILTWLNLLGSLVVATWVVVRRWVTGRDARGRGILIAQYSVPDNVNVMVAAHLMKRSATAIPAQLVSLAVRRKLRILDHKAGIAAGNYAVQFLSSEGVDGRERDVLLALFGHDAEPGKVRVLARADAMLGANVNRISTAARRAVVKDGLRARVGAGQLFFVLAAFLLGIWAFLALILTLVFLTSSWWEPVALIVTGFVFVLSLLALRIRGPLTAAGAEVRDYLVGLKLYLDLAEKERLRMLQSPLGAQRVNIHDAGQMVKLYEKLLPFAIIWGVEDKWMHELAIHAEAAGETLDWYDTDRGITALGVTSGVAAMAAAATYIPPSASSSSSWSDSGSSSSSGGSSGGSSSGGGGGGGGGGGW